MRHHALGTLIVTGLLMCGSAASASDAPVPVLQPGPGPTVPPKPSDPIPLPPTTPPSMSQSGNQRSPYSHLVADRAGSSSETLSGVLEAMNLEEGTGRLTTDMGITVSFSIPNPDLFRTLSIGERVTLKLDAAQRAVGVLQQTAPELPPPVQMPHTPAH